MPPPQARFYGRAVQRAGRILPFATCLHQSLVFRKMALRRGFDASVRLGLKRRGTGVVGHAWVISSNRVVFDVDPGAGYTPFSVDVFDAPLK